MADQEARDNSSVESPSEGLAVVLRELQSKLRESMEQWSQSMPDAGGGAQWLETWRTCAIEPGKLLDAQWSLLNAHHQLWLNTTSKLLGAGQAVEDVARPKPGNRRFKNAAWDANPVFSYIKQAYLLNARWVAQMLDAFPGLDRNVRESLDFYNRQIIDALAPTNFALTNPAVLEAIDETRGKNLLDGLSNLLGDLARSGQTLNISQTDPAAFEVGLNIAVTPGQVVFRNPLFELIQYEPASARVFRRPLLIVPPWINKYYILDLTPESSFVKWLVEQGYTVFVMSWVNPDERYRDKGFDDYVRDGVVAALDAVEQATGESRINAVGYCIGGTLLAITLAYMAATGDRRVNAATFLAAQVDFEDAGDLRAFTGPRQLAMLEPEVVRRGYLDGEQMASAFNLLRANDLVWHYVINNYLLGKSPPPFELLHWNADSTRLPARMLIEYLRGMYQENRLATPGAFEVLGTPVDLARITIPTFIQATREDHISPARSVWKSMHRFSGSKRFVLAGSGHIAGVVNPPRAGRYQHWTNDARKTYDELDEWLADAKESAGSWWPTWHLWLARRSGAKVQARTPGDGALAILEPAPGSYVKVRCRPDKEGRSRLEEGAP